jgi:hypothetical protein
MYRSIVALLAVGPLLAAPGAKEKEHALYFPVAEGSKWTMEVRYGDKAVEHTDVVTKVERKDQVFLVTVHPEPAGRGAGTVFEVSGKGISRRSFGGEATTDAVPLLRHGVKPGETWSSERKIPGVERAQLIYTMGNEEKVETPAGTFTALVVVGETVANGKTAIKVTSWYAPGVGLVKSTMITDTGERVQVLKSFTPGK